MDFRFCIGTKLLKQTKTLHSIKLYRNDTQLDNVVSYMYNVISRSNCFVLLTQEEVIETARLKVSVHNKKHCYIDVTMRKKFYVSLRAQQ